MTLHDNPQTHEEIRTQRLIQKKTLEMIRDESLGGYAQILLQVGKDKQTPPQSKEPTTSETNDIMASRA